MIKTLLFSTLYPSSARPIHGIFVETRLRELLKTGEVETKVVAPVPWFPFSGERWGEYGRLAATPHFEQRNGVDVHHPRYFLPPKIGMNIAPHTLALGALPTIEKLMRDGFDFDLIDAHYYYPDGVAATLLSKWLSKPFVVTARGSDINQIARYGIPKTLIRWSAHRAAASIAVSRALSDAMAELGIAREKLSVFRNGVDLEKFYPVSKTEARKKLDWPDDPTLISVGNLVENKGHHIAMESLTLLPGYRLAIIGDGPERLRLQLLGQRLGVSNRVIFIGRVAQRNLSAYYSAADVLILASSREGWPNVLLEAMACGTPVIASNVGGVPEIITRPVAGRMMAALTPHALVDACNDLFAKYPDSTSVRSYAEEFGWDATTRAQLDLFKEILHA